MNERTNEKFQGMCCHYRFLVIMLLLLLACYNTAFAGISTLSSAINKAGRQRMLTQRMLKAYVMIGIGIQAEKSKKQLSDAVNLYDSQLSELKDFAPNTEIKASLDAVEKLWVPYKKLLVRPVSRNNVLLLLEDDDRLLAASHKVVLLLQDASGTSIGRLVNISGRQRMLSQRLAKYYMLRAWGVDNTELRKLAEKAENEFKGALFDLMNAKENTRQISMALNATKEQWDLFEHGLHRNKKILIPLIVALTSEKVLVSMNNITGMYEKVSSN